MVVTITYFVHGTTTDNEQRIATGWNHGELSELGKKQSVELPSKINEGFDAVFSSDLKRAVDSAQLSFEGKYTLVIDKRL
ncbi:MAG: histidine phosphatase family protein, partial [Candidatus Nanoarchaeia archaeon]